jgi:hypothetical protein
MYVSVEVGRVQGTAVARYPAMVARFWRGTAASVLELHWRF